MAKAKEQALHAIEYLAHPERYAPRPVCVLFGDETFLRRQSLLVLRAAVLGGDEGDFSFSSFEGRFTQLRDVLDELATVAMFGGGRRLVLVEEADEFVTQYRTELEDYAARPAPTGTLVLDLKSFASTTRLYKAVAADGLLVDCGAPTGSKLVAWLVARAKQAQGVELLREAADRLVEMIGPELGLLDQELAKLALLAGSDKKVTSEMVSQSVGSWRARTTWDMLDSVLEGNVRGAMLQLDRLLASGEQPIAIMGPVAWSLRQFAAATRLVLQSEAAGRRIPVRQALEQAGVKAFKIQQAERQIKRLGRQRGRQLYRWLLEADLDLKGQSAIPPRLILERLLVRLAAPQQTMAGG